MADTRTRPEAELIGPASRVYPTPGSGQASGEGPAPCGLPAPSGRLTGSGAERDHRRRDVRSSPAPAVSPSHSYPRPAHPESPTDDANQAGRADRQSARTGHRNRARPGTAGGGGADWGASGFGWAYRRPASAWYCSMIRAGMRQWAIPGPHADTTRRSPGPLVVAVRLLGEALAELGCRRFDRYRGATLDVAGSQTMT